MNPGKKTFGMIFFEPLLEFHKYIAAGNFGFIGMMHVAGIKGIVEQVEPLPLSKFGMQHEGCDNTIGMITGGLHLFSQGDFSFGQLVSAIATDAVRDRIATGKYRTVRGMSQWNGAVAIFKKDTING